MKHLKEIEMTNPIELEEKYGAHNYHPLPVMLTRASGIYCWDNNDKKYIDMMSAYSAISHGHCHPKLVKVLTQQAQTLAVSSRAFYSNKLGEFLKKACELTGLDRALPMNTGAEAVETAIKAARKWAYTVKKIPENQAEIIVCHDNFHGRTTTIISMSTEAQYRKGFGPYTAGFKFVPYGDSNALEKAITSNTAMFLVEPIQGESGIHIPPNGYLKKCFEICQKNNVLFFADEIQTGLGRTGKLLACDHEEIKPDGLMLGKALGGGLLPVSLFLSRKDIMDVFTPGDHGSTFGGNPLAAAVGLEALNLLTTEKLIENAQTMGDYFMNQLRQISSPMIKEIRGKGLLIGIEIDKQKISAREICLKLLEAGILSKETHETVIRLAPPLMITSSQIDEAMEKIQAVF
jgi:ornithine--oxo-acid transaminase